MRPQKAKNPGTQIARVIRTLKARFRLAVTGTPVENSLTELWSLIDWVAPGHLGSLRDFVREVVMPLQDNYSDRSDALAADLHARIRPIFLRRTKQGVLSDQLPPLRVVRHDVPLSPRQESIYGDLARRAGRLSERAIGFLGKMFGVCAHPSINGQSARLGSLGQVSFPKGEALMTLLASIAAQGEKALIFANRKRVQRWLAAEVRRTHGVNVAVINGSITGSERRMKIVEEFSAQEGFGVLVLAPRAAGMGLNITAANHVIHYMREWNPAVENQATDRAYRIGQTRPVTVHHLIATSQAGATVEQLLDRLLEDKRQLMNDFVIPMGRPDVDSADLMAHVIPATLRAAS